MIKEIVTSSQVVIPQIPFVLESGKQTLYLIVKDDEKYRMINLNDSSSSVPVGGMYSNEYKSIEALLSEFEGRVYDFNITLV